MDFKKILCVYVIALYSDLMAAKTTMSQIIGYNDTEPSNIVATVVGYQNIRRHESGVDVPVFSIEKGAGAGQEIGILFYVIAPTNYAGHFFLVQCPRDYGPFENQQLPSETMFPKDKLFSFRLSDPITQDMLKSKNYMMAYDGFTTWHLPPTPYHWTINECEAYLTEKKALMERCKHELPELKRKLKQEIQGSNKQEPKTETFKELTENVRYMTNALVMLPTEIEEAEKQLKRLKKMAIKLETRMESGENKDTINK